MSSRITSFRSKPASFHPANASADAGRAASPPLDGHIDSLPTARPSQHHHRAVTISVPPSSSFTPQKTPARSFVQNNSSQNFSAAKAVHYSSAEVREQTASISQSYLSRRRPSAALYDETRPRPRYDSRLPASSDLIQSLDDPAEAGVQETRPQSSALSSLFRSAAEHDDREVSSAAPSSLPRGQLAATPHINISDSAEMLSETTPLLKHSVSSQTRDKIVSDTDNDIEGQVIGLRKTNKFQELVGYAKHATRYYAGVLVNPKRWDAKIVFEKTVLQPVYLLPCVFLGVLLNVLDALSYGMILFPLGEPIFANTGPDGISMFYISCIVSQLVYSCGGSIFRGAVGSEMIEVVPFFHKMTGSILARTGTSNPKVVMATVITSYALSSIITGIVFFALGALKLGSLVSFFPRHILIGCIGGVGFFLFVTGIEVSARIEGNLEYNIATLKKLFREDTIALWVVPLVLSIILKVAKGRITHPKISPYVVPTFFITVAAVFYIIVIAAPTLDVSQMRDSGWIFAEVEAGVPFYHFYSYYDFAAVDWNALASTIPAMFALTFFGILHVPINVPALAVAAKEDDLNLNRELVAHGFSNALSGMVGSIQNYLVYVNSEMFMSNGGDNRFAGIMLAFATFGVLVAGPDMIGYVPVMVVGALIFYLGIDLLFEAVVDTWGKMGKLEYLTVVAIVLIMGIYDFVAGILAGIVLACLSFVVQTSRKSAIRATYSGSEVESTVRRHPVQRDFLQKVGYQIYVTKLAGYLFFGSIVRVEKNSRALIEEEAFRAQPIRYLIFDLAHVSGIDYSAAEAFVRMQRVIQRRGVRMIMCGVENESEVGKGLIAVGLWRKGGDVEFLESLNSALEYCENELLPALDREQALRTGANSPQETTSPTSLDVPGVKPLTSLSSDQKQQPDFTGFPYNGASPRQNFLAKAASTTLDAQAGFLPQAKWASFTQPLPLLLKTFSDISPKNEDFWHKASPYFTRQTFAKDHVVFARGDDPDATGFFVLESGVLRADYNLRVGTYHESIVAGTTCGELPFFSGTVRTATVTADRDCVAWLLTRDAWERMQTKWPEGATELLRCALRLTKERVDAVTGYVVAVAG